MPRSNNMGRAYEYALCERIMHFFPNITLTARAADEQQRDILHFNDLSYEDQCAYHKSAELICCHWLNQKIDQRYAYTLDRLPDSAGVAGDVTDIRLQSNFEQINISLKHNHDALKHPRLTRIPRWLGMGADPTYTQIHNNIWAEFFLSASRLEPNATLFRELVAIDDEFINNNLYDPFCSFIADYLSRNANTIEAIQHMFDFLVGTYNFYKVIDMRDCIVIQDFINIPKPTDVAIEQTDKSYIAMRFNNGVVLSLRLHTASQRLIRSVKFDVRGEFDEMQSLVIPK